MHRCPASARSRPLTIICAPPSPSTPQAKRQLGQEQASQLGKKDGLFWMTTEDFARFFWGVQICRAGPGWCGIAGAPVRACSVP